MKILAGVSGRWGSVGFATDGRGHLTVREVYDALAAVERASLQATMQQLADTGRVINDERFKKIEGTDLFEFKKFQHRFVGFFLPGRRFVIAAYECKKKDKLTPSTLKRAGAVRLEMKREEANIRCVEREALSGSSRTRSTVGSTSRRN